MTNENQKPLLGATVFVDGTQMATATDDAGKFAIGVPGPGAYHVSVKMLGYAADAKDLMIQEQSVNLTFRLVVKPVLLREVKIGTDDHWAANYAIFQKEFLGRTKNSKDCTIINPEVIYFSTRNNMLCADADDFLIIENKRLGYRIKYLLKTFEHSDTPPQINNIAFTTDHKLPTHTAYKGEVFFEDLPGTVLQKQQWKKNRIEAYYGSMMHFLRSVFTNTSLQEGFLTNLPIPVDSSATSDKAFVNYHLKDLYVTYDPKKISQMLTKLNNPALKPVVDKLSSLVEKTAYKSELQLHGKETSIDSRGSVSGGYLFSFLIRGDWTDKRVADGLPFEYQPPASP